MEYSWFGRPSTNGKRNGYRFDHAFVSHAHRTAVTACQYDHSPRTAGLTDHSALTVTLDLAATTGDTGHAVGVGSTA
jgi:exodeoxyribonuclease-3